jgi:hypothetical protein
LHSRAIETAHGDSPEMPDAFRIDQRRIEHKQTEQLLSVGHFTIAEVPRPQNRRRPATIEEVRRAQVR